MSCVDNGLGVGTIQACCGRSIIFRVMSGSCLLVCHLSGIEKDERDRRRERRRERNRERKIEGEGRVR